MTELSLDQWEQIQETALWIHEQRDLEQLQKGTLERIEKLIPHRASFFDLCCVNDNRLLFFNPISTNMSDEDLSTYYQSYELSDYVAWCFNAAEPIVYRDSDMINDDARENSLIYREWMKPLELYYSLGCTVVRNKVMYGSITLFSGCSTHDFSDTEIKILTEVNRHLAVHFSLLWADGVYPDGRNEDIVLLAREAHLTDREAEVMRLAAEGKTNKEIGEGLYISESTVKKHLNALYRKLRVENRVQLMRLVFRRPGNRI